MANVVALALLVVAIWICLKKIVLVCGILALLVPFVGYRSLHANRKRIATSLGIAAVLIAPLHLATLPGSLIADADSVLGSQAVGTPNTADSPADGLGPDSPPGPQEPEQTASGELSREKIDQLGVPKTTIERFAEAPDPTRTALDRIARDLLAEHFPQGMGYMSFVKASTQHISYTTFTASGEQLSGVSLHNTYLHFVLEGGWVIIIIVLAASAVFVRALCRVYDAGDRQTFLALLTWVMMAGLYGWFHQLYLTDYMFGLFGFALGAARSSTHRAAAIKA
jgi:hypothetical protein